MRTQTVQQISPGAKGRGQEPFEGCIYKVRPVHFEDTVGTDCTIRCLACLQSI